jgi:glucose-1-phosphatase
MKAIVFDFGNVVGFFDHGKTLRRLADHTDLSVEEMRKRFYAAHLEEAFESGAIDGDAFVRRLQTLGRLRCDPEFIAEAWGDIFTPNEPVCALIGHLKRKYKLLLGSNTNELHARKFREQFADTLSNFDALVLSFEVKARKPERQFFEACQRLANCAPQECFFIDDLPANVAGARSLGWNGVVYTGFEQLRQELTRLNVL